MSHPNIIFLMADDMGYGDLGCYGAEKIPTPNIDQLAAEGVRFTDAHSASAVCTPSRYAVLTGRYCWRSRLKKWVLWDGYAKPLIPPDRLTVASMLKQEGYATAAIGKWHLGLNWAEKENGEIDYNQPIEKGPLALGFDYYFGIPASLDMPPYCFIENNHTVGVPSVEKDPYHAQQREGLMVPGWKDEEVGPQCTEKAISFIKNHVDHNSDQPFFMYFTPSAPHRPCVPPDFIKGRSQAGPRGDMVCEVDWTVGQLMQTLDELEIADNTLFIVTSDNGARNSCYNGKDYGHKSNGDLRGQKADIWDGGHREPFVARWPEKIEAGTTCPEMICLSDLMATCAEITERDLPVAAGEDSFSFLPKLTGEENNKPVREAIVHHSGAGLFAVRKGPWKMIRGLGSGGFTEPVNKEVEPGKPEGQLYNMENDLQEEENLWQSRPDIVEKLTGLLEKYQKEGRSRN